MEDEDPCFDAPSCFYDITSGLPFGEEDDFFDYVHPNHEPDEPNHPTRSLIDEDGDGEPALTVPSRRQEQAASAAAGRPALEYGSSQQSFGSGSSGSGGSGGGPTAGKHRKRSVVHAGLKTPDERRADCAARAARLGSPVAHMARVASQPPPPPPPPHRWAEPTEPIDDDDDDDMLAELLQQHNKRVVKAGIQAARSRIKRRISTAVDRGGIHPAPRAKGPPPRLVRANTAPVHSVALVTPPPLVASLSAERASPSHQPAARSAAQPSPSPSPPAPPTQGARLSEDLPPMQVDSLPAPTPPPAAATAPAPVPPAASASPPAPALSPVPAQAWPTVPSATTPVATPAASATPAAATTIAPPAEFVCPISREVMADPVCSAHGVAFERAAIERWFKRGHTACPLTGQQMPSTALVPNLSLANLIRSWREQHGQPPPQQQAPTPPQQTPRGPTPLQQVPSPMLIDLAPPPQRAPPSQQQRAASPVLIDVDACIPLERLAIEPAASPAFQPKRSRGSAASTAGVAAAAEQDAVSAVRPPRRSATDSCRARPSPAEPTPQRELTRREKLEAWQQERQAAKLEEKALQAIELHNTRLNGGVERARAAKPQPAPSHFCAKAEAGPPAKVAPNAAARRPPTSRLAPAPSASIAKASAAQERRERKGESDLLSLLSQHNSRVGPSKRHHAARTVSVNQARAWEKRTGRAYSSLSADERESVNAELLQA